MDIYIPQGLTNSSQQDHSRRGVRKVWQGHIPKAPKASSEEEMISQLYKVLINTSALPTSPTQAPMHALMRVFPVKQEAIHSLKI